MVDYRQIATAAGAFDALTTDSDCGREVLLVWNTSPRTQRKRINGRNAARDDDSG